MDDVRNSSNSGSRGSSQGLSASSSSHGGGTSVASTQHSAGADGRTEALWILLSWRFFSLAVLAASMAAARLSVGGLIVLGGLVVGLCIKGALLCMQHGMCERRMWPSITPAAGSSLEYRPPPSYEQKTRSDRSAYGSKDHLQQ